MRCTVIVASRIALLMLAGASAALAQQQVQPQTASPDSVRRLGTVSVVGAPSGRGETRGANALAKAQLSAGAAGAQFRSGNGRLTISGAAAGEFTLTIPRSLARARVEVNGSVYLSKERGQLHIFAPVADTVGSEIVLPITR